ncbi:hypothetical protein J6590_016926 [Homalodisca vitripennis]|nr:hypothetical protein J6590_016926 [Homalodisca vitripennis]
MKTSVSCVVVLQSHWPRLYKYGSDSTRVMSQDKSSEETGSVRYSAGSSPLRPQGEIHQVSSIKRDSYE